MNAFSAYLALLKGEEVSLKKNFKGGYLRMLHWSTLGQSRHSSGSGALCGRAFNSPEKWAHFAGDSNTFGYSVGFTSMIFMFSVTMSSFDMQYGQA